MEDLRYISPTGMESHPLDALPELLKRTDGFLWLDILAFDADSERALTKIMGLHPLAMKECRARVPIPKLHVYADHFFVVLYSVELETDGKLRLFQINNFIHESRWFVSVHGGSATANAADLLERETQQVRSRIEAGRFLPKTPAELGHAIVSAGAHRMEASVEQIARDVAKLEAGVTRGRLREYEGMLSGLFDTRHNLMTLRTLAAQSREVAARMVNFSRGLRDESTLYLQDLVDQFARLSAVCDSEKELLQELLDLYQTRVANDLSQLVRRLTAIGAILVADTLVAGIYGMNFKNMPELDWTYGYPMALGVMAAISVGMALYFRSKDWL